MTIENYQLVSYFNRRLFEHGGVAIYIKNNVCYRERKDLVKLSSEMNCEIAAIELKPSKIVVICMYRPDYDFDAFKHIVTVILNKISKEGKKMILTGDFNLNMLDSNGKINKFKSLLLNYNCKYLINKPTRIKGKSATCIDNFMVNFDDRFCEAEVLQKRLSDHNVIILKTQLAIYKPKTKQKQHAQFRRNLCKGNYDYFHHLINNDATLLEQIECSDDPNYKMEIFLKAILHYFNIAFPEKKTRKKVKEQQKWHTKGIETSKNNLQNMLIMEELAPCPLRRLKIKRYKNVLRKVLSNAKRIKLSERINRAPNKVKEGWKIINEHTNHMKKPHNVNIEKIRNSEGTLIKDSKSIASIFNEFFSSVGQRIAGHLKGDLEKCTEFIRKIVKPQSHIKFSEITIRELHTHIRNLKSKHSKDSYNLDSGFIKNIFQHNDYILEVLLSIINSCLKKGVFPRCLKTGRVIPIHKKDSKEDPDNYRPICILPAISKILESIVKQKIVEYFESNSLFNLNQFGFRKGRSTVMVLRKVVDFVLEALNQSQTCSSLFCDLSKAFDSLRHDVLLEKLKFYGFQGVELQILKNYLEDRTQVVNVNGICSEKTQVNIGVPQGSILGPVLFLIYVNDLPNSLPDDTMVTLFADDTHIGLKDRDQLNIRNKILETLAILKEWFSANGIRLNTKKTTLITYRRNNKKKKEMDCFDDMDLHNETHTTFLGYEINDKIDHVLHMDKVSKKLASGNYALLRLKPLVSKKVLTSVYYAYIHANLSYAITVWGNGAEIQRVLKLQKRSIRIMHNLRSWESARPYFQKSRIMTVISLFLYKSLLEIHKDKENMKKRKDIHKYNTRNKDKLCVPKVRLVRYYKQGIPIKISLYNMLPLILTGLPWTDFQRKLKTFFQENPFYSINEFIDCVKLPTFKNDICKVHSEDV